MSGAPPEVHMKFIHLQQQLYWLLLYAQLLSSAHCELSPLTRQIGKLEHVARIRRLVCVVLLTLRGGSGELQSFQGSPNFRRHRIPFRMIA